MTIAELVIYLIFITRQTPLCAGNCLGVNAVLGTEGQKGWLVAHKKFQNSGKKLRRPGILTQICGIAAGEAQESAQLFFIAGQILQSLYCNEL